jgi:hypothetical protein
VIFPLLLLRGEGGSTRVFSSAFFHVTSLLRRKSKSVYRRCGCRLFILRQQTTEAHAAGAAAETMLSSDIAIGGVIYYSRRVLRPVKKAN